MYFVAAIPWVKLQSWEGNTRAHQQQLPCDSIFIHGKCTVPKSLVQPGHLLGWTFTDTATAHTASYAYGTADFP